MNEGTVKSALDSIEFQFDRASKRLIGGIVLAAVAALASLLFQQGYFSSQVPIPGLDISIPLPIAPYVLLPASAAMGVATDLRFWKATNYVAMFLSKLLQQPAEERGHNEELLLSSLGKVSPFISSGFGIGAVVFGSYLLHLVTTAVTFATNYSIRNPGGDSSWWLLLPFSAMICGITTLPYIFIVVIYSRYRLLFDNYIQSARPIGT